MGTVRVPEQTGYDSRPSLVWLEGFAVARVVEARPQRGEGITRRVVVGTDATVVVALAVSDGL